MKRWRFWFITIGFDVFWAAAVAGRERLALPLLVLALLAFGLHSPKRWPLLAGLAITGIVMDSLWLYADLFRFAPDGGFPLWMAALWIGWSVWWCDLLQRFHPAWYWLLIAGALGGPVSYFIGERMGAMTLLAPPWQVWPMLAVGWALFMVVSGLLLNRRLS